MGRTSGDVSVKIVYLIYQGEVGASWQSEFGGFGYSGEDSITYERQPKAGGNLMWRSNRIRNIPPGLKAADTVNGNKLNEVSGSIDHTWDWTNREPTKAPE